MSDKNDMNETPLGGGAPPNFSEMLDKVLANPEIISTVAAALSKGGEEPALEKEQNDKKAEEIANDTTSPDVAAMMQKLPDVMKLVGPMMSKGSDRGSVRVNDKRTCLLNAIKPYLNPHRCEAVDYIIRFSELSELIKKIH